MCALGPNTLCSTLQVILLQGGIDLLLYKPFIVSPPHSQREWLSFLSSVEFEGAVIPPWRELHAWFLDLGRPKCVVLGLLLRLPRRSSCLEWACCIPASCGDVLRVEVCGCVVVR